MESIQVFESYGAIASLLLPAIALLIIWSITWKGLALWRAAERREKLWFIFFLLVHTLGIVEMIYIFIIARDRKVPTVPSSTSTGL